MQQLSSTSQLLSKLVLNCQVALPSLSTLTLEEKVTQRVTAKQIHGSTNQPHDAKKTYLKEKQSQQSAKSDSRAVRCLEVKKKVEAAESAFRRNQFQTALQDYTNALNMLSEMKSIDYYVVLNKKAECLKKLRRVDEVFTVYSELSLVFAGN